ncbi:hypothetical protein DV736_g1138, partial [Chaetothyriales sp. CBS 134916]
MAEQQEDDFSSLPLEERFVHKAWKVRKEAYEAAAKEFALSADESAPIFARFHHSPELWKAAAADANVAAQVEGLAALCAYLKHGGPAAAARSRPHTVQAIYEKAVASARPAAKQHAVEALLLYVENDKPDLLLDDLLPALCHKQPKVAAASLAAVTAVYHSFGTRVVDPKPVLKQLPRAFGHADKNIRAEAQALAVELYRWHRDAIKTHFWADLKPPVDVMAKMPADFYDMVASAKWKERKDSLDAVFAVLDTPRIKDTPIDDLVRALAKCMKDANVAVVTVAAHCIEKLALGLRKAFAKHRSAVLEPVLERLKEKKQSVADALGAALDAVFQSSSMSDCLDTTIGFLAHKNPNVKAETAKFVVRCLRTTRDVPTKAEQKQIADAATKLLTESTEQMRAVGAEILGTLMKIIGERAMNAYLDGLDDIRKNKIKDYFDTTQVKAKEKPKPVAAPPPSRATAAAASAVGKKVVGGAKKPVAKKLGPALGGVGPVGEDDEGPKTATKAVAKPGAPSKSALAAPNGVKLGTLKRPGLASPQPRKLVSPLSQPSDDDRAAASPSKFGAGRGLTSKPLGRPAVPPKSPSSVIHQPPAGLSAVSAVQLAELEELRAHKDGLTALTDSLRSSNTKLLAEISELQNQNAQLIEDHTRDVLQIKAKETQLTRARGESDVLRGEMDSLRKECERYKPPASRPMSGTALNRTSSTASAASARSGLSTTAKSLRPQPQSGFPTSNLGPTDEKENHSAVDTLAARRKIKSSAPGSHAGGGSDCGAVDPRETSAAGKPENWKRAAEVTSQLKARIEAMKARQGLQQRH